MGKVAVKLRIQVLTATHYRITTELGTDVDLRPASAIGTIAAADAVAVWKHWDRLKGTP